MFDPQNTVVVGGLGLIISIVGLVITVGGFVVTLIQIRKTKSATEAAVSAVSHFKARVDKSDAAVEAARTVTFLEVALTNLVGRDWKMASINLWEAQKILNRAKYAFGLDGEQSSLTDKNTHEFISYVQILEEAQSKMRDYDASDLKLCIRTQLNVLEDVVNRKRKEIQNG